MEGDIEGKKEKKKQDKKAALQRIEDSQRRHPSVESDESLGYHWGSWLGDGSQLWEGLTEGDDVSSLEPSPLPSLAGESAASSPARRRPMRTRRLARARRVGCDKDEGGDKKMIKSWL